MQFAEKIRSLVEMAAFRFEDTDIPVTISIGVASLRRSCRSRPSSSGIADDHLYAAKAAGRNRVVG